MKYLFSIFKAISFFAVFIFAASISAQSQCNLQYSLDEVVNNISDHANQNVVVAGQVDSILVDEGDTPGFVIKSASGSELHALGGSVVRGENGENYWRIKTDIHDVDAYGEEIIILTFINVYPGDYVVVCGGMDITNIANISHALRLWNVEVINPDLVKNVEIQKDFNIKIEQAINPYFDWVVSEYQSDFYFEKIEQLGNEAYPLEDNILGVTTKSFLFKAVESGFATIMFDYFDCRDQSRPKRIDRKKYFIHIE